MLDAPRDAESLWSFGGSYGIVGGLARVDRFASRAGNAGERPHFLQILLTEIGKGTHWIMYRHVAGRNSSFFFCSSLAHLPLYALPLAGG